MVRVTEAVQSAKRYLAEVFPSAKDRKLQLEGVELSDDAKFWFVTFSYQAPSTETDIEDLAPPFFQTFKTVKVRSEDGEFFGARNGLSSMGLM